MLTLVINELTKNRIYIIFKIIAHFSCATFSKDRNKCIELDGYICVLTCKMEKINNK